MGYDLFVASYIAGVFIVTGLVAYGMIKVSPTIRKMIGWEEE